MLVALSVSASGFLSAQFKKKKNNNCQDIIAMWLRRMQKFEQFVFKLNEYSFILVDASTTDVLKHAVTMVWFLN